MAPAAPDADPEVGAIPPAPPYADDHADEAALASNIRWLVTVIDAHDTALSRRQQTFDALISKMALDHDTQMNKWRLKREHFAEQRERALTRFAHIARGLGLTPDDLLATVPPSDRDLPVAE
jgi:hypothetical protein